MIGRMNNPNSQLSNPKSSQIPTLKSQIPNTNLSFIPQCTERVYFRSLARRQPTSNQRHNHQQQCDHYQCNRLSSLDPIKLTSHFVLPRPAREIVSFQQTSQAVT